MTSVNPRPLARTDRLLIEELDDETLVYDLDSHLAHCLNESAAVVWRASDGRRTVADLAAILDEQGLPGEESVVWLALERLEKAGLLVEDEARSELTKGITRKEVLRILGAAAGMTLLMPAVETLAAPQAPQAASCVGLAQCRSETPTKCGSGLPICAQRSMCCGWNGIRGQGARCVPKQC